MTLFFRLGILFLLLSACDQKTDKHSTDTAENQIKHASGLAIYNYDGYSLVKVSNPWPGATQDYHYILKEKSGTIPDSLSQYQIVNIPIKTIVVTSTTHVPSLEMLSVENSLIGFPQMEYISSERVRNRIEGGHVREIGNNQNLNTEVIIDIEPDVIIGYGIDNNNAALDNLEKSGLMVLLNGDWNEQTPLGKAEWIKFFGALYGLQDQADAIFSKIESDYSAALSLAGKVSVKPTVMAGAIYENLWYLPQGNSWGAQIIAQAGGDYLWSQTSGTGSLSLPFEKVLETANQADFWIGPAQFTSLKEMADSNSHYTQFKAFQDKNVYSFSTKKGKTGGVIYYELAPNRPDLVLKDMIKILHPELLPDYQLYFFEKLQ